MECKVKEAWVSVFCPVLVGIELPSTEPNDADMVLVFQLLTAIAMELRERPEVSLANIFTELDGLGFLNLSDENVWAASQLVFACVGWMSMLLVVR